jgi:DNA modification methylase
MSEVVEGDCRTVLRQMNAGTVQCAVTSPPYFGLRDYQVDGQIGLEPTVDAYVAELVSVFREVRRVLRDDGCLWLNLGDSYAANRGTGSSPHVGKKQASNLGSLLGKLRVPDGLKEKDLIGVPWMVAFALRADGWYLRSDIIWAKPNPMPESVRDRPTKAHEYLFLLTKNARYYWDADAVREPCESGPSDIRKMVEGLDRIGGKNKDLCDPLVKASGSTNIGQKRSVGDPSGRNMRSVWTIATAPFPGSHFATFPPALVEPCIKAGTSEKGACPACGAPWVRLREPTEEYREVLERANQRGDWYPRTGTNEKREDGTKHGKLEGGIRPDYRTTGWEPSCPCDAGEPVPCVVLDPFGGAGTVGLVADRLGRDAILIELNPEYAAMARKRITNDAPLFAQVS